MFYREEVILACSTCGATSPAWEHYSGGPQHKSNVAIILPEGWTGGIEKPLCSEHVEKDNVI